MPRHKSRAKRLAEAIEAVRTQVEELRGMNEDHLDELELSDSIALEGIQELQLEMEEWKENWEGTNFERTDAYARVEETCDSLAEATSDLEGCLEEEPESVDELEEVLDRIEEQLSNLESVEFPGRYGQ